MHNIENISLKKITKTLKNTTDIELFDAAYKNVRDANNKAKNIITDVKKMIEIRKKDV